jgi:integrase
VGGRLSALGVKALVKPGRYGDGQGLHLYVKGAKQRTWVLRYMKDGKSRDMGLGGYPALSLAEARAKADAARKLLRENLDPLDARQSDKRSVAISSERTFKAAAEALIADKSAGWRNLKHRRQWAATLETHAYPVFGDWPIEKVDVTAVLKALQPIWRKTPETASRLRGRIEAVLDAARARGWREGENPARWKGQLATLLPSPRKVRAPEHRPALPWQQMSPFIRELRLREGMSARAMELAILTAARPGEIRGMTWGEVDFDAMVWTIPGKRMKAGKTHRVPLSDSAIRLLRQVHPEKISSGRLVFPGTVPSKPISDASMTMTLRRMNSVPEGKVAPWRDPVRDESITVHGFRSTFRVWAGEQAAYPREVVESALAHTLKDKAEAAYQRSDFLERRRPLMKDWAEWCEGPGRRLSSAS